jgi:hypothetical protein
MTELEPNESDAVTLWAEIHRLRAAVKGPEGYDSWQDAATAERVRRVRAEAATRLDAELIGRLSTIHAALGKMQRNYGEVGSRDVEVAEWNESLFDAMRAIGRVLCELPADKVTSARQPASVDRHPV